MRLALPPEVPYVTSRMRPLASVLAPVVGAGAALSVMVAGCKSRSFNPEGGTKGVVRDASSVGRRESPRTPADPAEVAALARDLRAGLALALPPASDEAGLERLSRVLDFGVTPPDFSLITKHVLQEAPSAEAIEAGDLVDPEEPKGPRTITNEACWRDPASWKLTFVQFLPYERLVAGSYTAIAAWEKQARTRLLVPLTIRATFQPWCLSTRTPSKAQVFVLEQALQFEWRIYDLGEERQRGLAMLVAKRNTDLQAAGNDADRILLEIATAFETTEAAGTRAELLSGVRDVARSWKAGRSAVDNGALRPVEALLAQAAREDFGWRNEKAKETPPLHPGFLVSRQFEEALHAFLKRHATKSTLHAVRSTFSESQGKPVYARLIVEAGALKPERLTSGQLVGPPWRVVTFGDMGYHASERDTGSLPRFEVSDRAARAAFDEVDLEPSLFSAMPRSELGKVRKRLTSPNRINVSTTHCSLCHGLGGGTILSGHTEAEGVQISVSSLLRASEDATALARELSAD